MMIDLTNKQYGTLRVIRELKERVKATWLCLCDCCGCERIVLATDLLCNKVDSCVRSKNKDSKKFHRLKYIYGLTKYDYDLLYEKQNGCCAICKRPENSLERGLVVDHCHTTNKVRGLLCNKCNTGLGKFEDKIASLEEAIKYLSC